MVDLSKGCLVLIILGVDFAKRNWEYRNQENKPDHHFFSVLKFECTEDDVLFQR